MLLFVCGLPLLIILLMIGMERLESSVLPARGGADEPPPVVWAPGGLRPPAAVAGSAPGSGGLTATRR